jgi:hypothetical protein
VKIRRIRNMAVVYEPIGPNDFIVTLKFSDKLSNGKTTEVFSMRDPRYERDQFVNYDNAFWKVDRVERKAGPRRVLYKLKKVNGVKLQGKNLVELSTYDALEVEVG